MSQTQMGQSPTYGNSNSAGVPVVRDTKQRDIATVCIYGLSLLSAGLFLFLPLANLLSPSPWQRYMGAIHGFASLMAVVVAYAGHLAFPLLRRNAKILPKARTSTFWASCLSFLAIVSGNWSELLDDKEKCSI